MIERNLLIIIDISNPEMPRHVGTFEMNREIMGVSVSGNYAYLACEREAGLRVVNISRPSRPIEVGYYGTPGAALNISVGDDGLIYVADNTNLGIYSNMLLNIRDETLQQQTLKYCLCSAYPNPFNSTTTIRYTLPTPLHVSLEVYNTLGQRMTTLFNGNQTAGFHTCTFAENDLPSGLYFVRLNAGTKVFTQKIMLIK
ncbi:T9SS type A sorting domain-containing protein [bacterium]|nr:T9SS type A sorting domain-containing protein [bacterium]